MQGAALNLGSNPSTISNPWVMLCYFPAKPVLIYKGGA